jgi:molecular chaperone DnaK
VLVGEARQAVREEAPLPRLRELTSELQQLLQGLMAVGPGQGGGPSQPPPDDDVIDADFTPT